MNPSERYIELLKKALINELYIENEAKLIYLIKCLFGKQVPQNALLVNPEAMTELIGLVAEAKGSGGTVSILLKDSTGKQQPANHLRNYTEFAHSMIGRQRMDNLHHCIETVLEEDIPGDLIETGVWRGGACILMRGILASHGIEDRTVWVADSFEGVPVSTLKEDQGMNLSKTSFPVLAVGLDKVKALFARYDLLDDQVQFLKGWFKDSLPSAPIGQLSILRLDGDLYESTMDALTHLYHRVSKGGFVIIDDYHALDMCKQAVTDFRQSNEIEDEIEPIDDIAVFWRKAKA